MLGIRKFFKGIRLFPVASTSVSEKGDLEVLSTGGKLNYHDGSAASPVVTEASTATLTNKTISGASNTVNNVPAANITSTPSGNLAASDVQGALNELQSDIDTRATSSALGSHESDTSTHGVGVIVGTTESQTLTNKTLTTPIISSISNTGTLTLPTSTDTLVGRATTDTLSNKTLAAPVVTGQLDVAPGSGNGIDVSSAGALEIGASVGANNLTLGGATSTVVVPGNFQVDGTTTSVNSTNLEVTDKNILVNNGGNDASSEGAGLTVERTATNGSLIYKDASATKFAAGAASAEVDLVGTTSTQTLTNKTLAVASNTISATADHVAIYSGSNALASEAQLAISRGGTGQATAQAAIDALLPSQTGNGGKVLGTNGTTSSWTTAGTGDASTNTATSVDSEIALFSGTTGKLLKRATGTGTAYITNGVLSTAPSATYQVFTSGSGTYTKSTNARYIKVKMVGGGGGGGGGGGASAASAGSAGGSTTFGAHTCTGGGAGNIDNGAPAAGGTGSIGVGGSGYTIPGGIGGGIGVGDGSTFTGGGAGGGTPFGSGGGSGYPATTGNSAPTNSGAGGSGGGGSNNGTHTAGNGGSGGGYAEFIIASPSATYSYGVGAGGAGGAGSTGGTGGAGAAGIIIVEEFY